MSDSPIPFDKWLGTKRRMEMVNYVMERLKKNTPDNEIIAELLPYFSERKILEYIESAKRFLEARGYTVKRFKALLESLKVEIGKSKVEVHLDDGTVYKGIIKQIGMLKHSIYPQIVMEEENGNLVMIAENHIATIEKIK